MCIAALQEADPSSREWQLGQAYASEALHQLGLAPQAADHLQAALAQLVDQPSLADQVRFRTHNAQSTIV